MYANNCVYQGVRGWDAFEPALSRAERMDANQIWQLASDIPEEWYEWDKDGLKSVGRNAQCSPFHDSQTHLRLSQFQSESVSELAGSRSILTSVIFALSLLVFSLLPQSRHSAGAQ